MNDLEKFENWALNNNVTIERCNKKNSNVENDVLKRFENLDKAHCFLDFLNYFSKVESEDQTVWFWCFNDYKDSDDEEEFVWNEFEKLSISYSTDESEKAKIKEWWHKHLPISVSVKNEYSYLAIDLSDNGGMIVMGNEPFFEETIVIADSFEDLLAKIIANEIEWF